MTEHSQHYHAGRFANFTFDCDGDWIRVSADLGDLGRKIGDELRRVAASIDFEGLRQEIDQTLGSVMDEVQRAAAAWNNTEAPRDPGAVHVNVQMGARPAGDATASDRSKNDERMIVLNLVAEGKITPEEGVRLIEALAR